ncbi:multicopper oxidase-domain-containing protein [Nemania sp. FL0916]|nr:multicopper oxidase-domain-containing protein [Nemania sp. FL0916]
MRYLPSLTGILAGFLAGTGQCAPSQTSALETRIPGSCNTPSNRACWSPGFDIFTDYEAKTPPGSIKTFNWEVTERDNWVGPDGRVKSKVMLINNQYPGPTLEANWGDTVVINIKNSLRLNGTSIHWHGMRQLGTNIQDGANGVTECPLRPGATKTYKFRLTQYGTSWYHSHFSAQYANGVFGSIVIHGPASQNYDIDLGAYPINDYYLPTADEIVLAIQHGGGIPPQSDNVLFNGTNINPNGAGGSYSRLTLTPGKRHRLRLINPSVEHSYQVSIVNHNMTVIATDLVPINATATTMNTVFLGVGQRLDVLIDGSQTPGNYWMNVTFQQTQPVNLACGSSKNLLPAAIVQYATAPSGLPTNPGTAPPNAGCRDSLDYKPVVPRQAPLDQFMGTELNVTFDANTVLWKVNDSSINVNWDRPIIEYVLEGNTSYPRSENAIIVNQKNKWTFWVIENTSPLPHPMHLHGHDFVVLGASAPGASTFTTNGRDEFRTTNASLTNTSPGAFRATASSLFTAVDQSQLNGNNPTRRDVTMLPAGGWLVVAFKADNPGDWLFHCHIAWHVSGGLSVDFLERVPEQKKLISPADAAAFRNECKAWSQYFDNSGLMKIDSGL